MSDSAPSPRSEYVGRMFGAIADRYDLMNRVMTFGMDQRWRRQAVEVSEIKPGQTALDVATGTGDLAFQLAEAVGPQGSVIGVDFVPEMLALAERKARGRNVPVRFERADALDLPFESERFDAVTCAFGLRNFDDRQRALDEMARVARRGGRVVVLELTPPQNELARRYMHEVVPRLGQLLASARDAYTYLPESAEEFPGPEVLGRMLQRSGLRKVTYRLLNFGTVGLHWGEKPAD
jgi:demethylmenaquinone methyltransferase/2-methoxy-6-polyprenyl-1,4-benzoquinol methylase